MIIVKIMRIIITYLIQFSVLASGGDRFGEFLVKVNKDRILNKSRNFLRPGQSFNDWPLEILTGQF